MSNALSILNKTHAKRFALDYADTKRKGKFTRYGQSFHDRIEARCRAVIRQEVDNHPTKGTTLL